MMNGTHRVVASSLLLVLSCIAVAGASEFLLYAPGPSDGKVSAGPKEGVLVRSITIQKGDTLYSLSRKLNGQGTYYPQFLLFNEILDPNLIYAGNKLLVPVPPGEKGEKVLQRLKTDQPARAAEKAKEPRRETRAVPAPPVAREAKRDSKQAAVAKPKQSVPAQTVPAAKPAATPTKSPAAKSAADSEQALFEKGVSAYKSGAYQQSLDAFERFLSRYPSSALVPDATLYRADALLKLAGQ